MYPPMGVMGIKSDRGQILYNLTAVCLFVLLLFSILTRTNWNLFESSPDLPLKPRPIVRPAKIVVYNNIATTIFVIFNGRVAYLSTV